jgi:antimicrobial peptide system SdpB family protein
MLTSLGKKLSAHFAESKPWTNVYGFARTLLALGTVVTFLVNDTKDLFVRVAGMPEAPLCTGTMRPGFWCVMPRDHFEIGRWICVAALLLVASGWRPRFTGILHWYVAWSFQTGASSLDGGDQIHAVLALLLLPVTLTDTRKWHWDPYVERADDRFLEVKKLFAMTSLWLIRLQVAGVYFHAAAGKYATPEWANGTALYYWLGHPLYGVTSWARPFIMPILTHSTVALMTWGVVVLEFALMAGLFAPKKYWKYLLVAGLALHIGIALFQGLVSFCFSMSAALVLFYRPVDQVLPFDGIRRALSRLGTSVLPRMRTTARALATSVTTTIGR